MKPLTQTHCELSPRVQKERKEPKEKRAKQAGTRFTSQPRLPASAKRLTSEKSGIVTSSRSRGRPLLLAALLKKLATEPQLSWMATRGQNRTTKKPEDVRECPLVLKWKQEVETVEHYWQNLTVHKQNKRSDVFKSVLWALNWIFLDVTSTKTGRNTTHCQKFMCSWWNVSQVMRYYQKIFRFWWAVLSDVVFTRESIKTDVCLFSCPCIYLCRI